MNWLNVLLVHVLSIRSEKGSVDIKKIYFMENDCWGVDQPFFKMDDGYLYSVNVEFKGKHLFEKDNDFSNLEFHPLKFSNTGYFRLENVSETLNNYVKSPEDDNIFIKFCYSFTDEPVKDWRYIGDYEGKIHKKITYRLLEKQSESHISLRWDEPVIRRFHLNEMFETNVYIMSLRFNEYIKLFNEKWPKEEEIRSLEDSKDFDLYYFKSYSECLENLKRFIKDLKCFKLINDDDQNINYEEKSTTLKASQFTDRVCEKLDLKIKEIELETSLNELKLFVFNYSKGCHGIFENIYVKREVFKGMKTLFNECCDYLKDKISKNEIFLSIGGKYDINYYLGEFYTIIDEIINKNLKHYCLNEARDVLILTPYLIDCFFKQIEKNQKIILKELLETEYIPKHFFEVIKKDIRTSEDYINVEKMMCDYHNILVYFFGFDGHDSFNINKSFDSDDSNTLFSYDSPVFIDKFNIKIIDGIQITFCSSNEFGKIKAFDENGKEVNIEQDTDYFVRHNIYLYYPSDTLRRKNIQKIEVITSDNQFKEIFEIEEYLNK